MDPVKSNDGDFDKQQKQLIPPVVADPGKYGVTQAEVDALKGAGEKWNVNFAASEAARIQADITAKAKDDARSVLEPLVRATAQKIHVTPGMTNATRAAAGLPGRDGNRTSVGVPGTRPVGRTVPQGHATLKLNVVDESTPLRKAKPDGVRGYQIWRFIGDQAPADPSGYTYVKTSGRTPFVDAQPVALAGKVVFYLLRWVNTKDEPGPWSDVIATKYPI